MKTNEKLYRARCHCGAVEIEAKLDLSGGGTRCNCSICQRLGTTNVNAKPDALRVLKGEDALSEYRASKDTPNWRKFCKHCGVHVFGGGNVPAIGGEFVSVNLNCVEGLELATLPIGYWDGRHNNWQAGLREQPWPALTAAA